MSATKEDVYTIYITQNTKKFLKYLQENFVASDRCVCMVYISLDGLVVELYEVELSTTCGVLSHIISHMKLLFPLSYFNRAPPLDIQSSNNINHPCTTLREIEPSELFESILTFEGNVKLKLNMTKLIELSSEFTGGRVVLNDFESYKLEESITEKVYTNYIERKKGSGEVSLCKFYGGCVVPLSEITTSDSIYILENRWSKNKIRFEGSDVDWRICDNNIQQYQFSLEEKYRHLFSTLATSTTISRSVTIRSPIVLCTEKVFCLEYMNEGMIFVSYLPTEN